MTSYGLQVRIQRIHSPSTHFRRAYIHFTCACGHVDTHSHLCYLAHLGDEFVRCLGVLSRFLGPLSYLLHVTWKQLEVVRTQISEFPLVLSRQNQ